MYGLGYVGVPSLRYMFIEGPRSLYDKLWWRYMPGVKIDVKWPQGKVIVGPSAPGWSGLGPTFEYIESADPNNHYRPWLEQNVGRQGWDWNWRIGSISPYDDSPEDRLTIKIRQGKSKHASFVALKWST